MSNMDKVQDLLMRAEKPMTALEVSAKLNIDIICCRKALNKLYSMWNIVDRAPKHVRKGYDGRDIDTWVYFIKENEVKYGLV